MGISEIDGGNALYVGTGGAPPYSCGCSFFLARSGPERFSGYAEESDSNIGNRGHYEEACEVVLKGKQITIKSSFSSEWFHDGNLVQDKADRQFHIYRFKQGSCMGTFEIRGKSDSSARGDGWPNFEPIWRGKLLESNIVGR